MATLRIIDALSPGQWRLSADVRGGSSAYGLQFTLFRGELIGIMTARDGTCWWLKYDQQGFPTWVGGRVLTWWAKERCAIAVLDDILYAACIGGGDGAKNIYLASTQDLKTWKNMGIIGTVKSPAGPSMVGFDGKLHLEISGEDAYVYNAEVKWDGTLIKDWYKSGGGTKFSPAMAVWNNGISSLITGWDNKLYFRMYNKASLWGEWKIVNTPSTAASGPSIVVYKDNRPYISWRGTSGDALTTMTHNGTSFEDPIVLPDEFAEAETGMGTYQGRLMMSFSGTSAMKNLKPNL